MKRIYFAEEDRYNSTFGLYGLIKVFPKNAIMVEVGCFAGESTKIFSEVCKKVYAVDVWETIEPYGMVNADNLIVARMLFKEKRFTNVEVIEKLSIEAAEEFDNGSLDIVYIDACHFYDETKQDILSWKDKVKPGGIISGHDYHQEGVNKAVNEILGKPAIVYSDESWLVWQS